MGRRKKSSLLTMLRDFEERDVRVRIVCGSFTYVGKIAAGNPEVLMLNIGAEGKSVRIVNLVVAHIGAVSEYRDA